MAEEAKLQKPDQATRESPRVPYLLCLLLLFCEDDNRRGLELVDARGVRLSSIYPLNDASHMSSGDLSRLTKALSLSLSP